MKDYLQIKDVNEMTINELVGQTIMCGLPYDYLDNESKEFIKKYNIGNFILFARNYKDTNGMKKFMKDLYEFSLDNVSSFPLVSIDQEGGMVTRLFKDVTFPASPLTTSLSSVKDACLITGRIIGEDMMKLGLNLNLAPCLEINHELKSHLVNVRSYGYNKEMVIKGARSFIDGLHESNCLSCLKHFPGAGKSTKDSHLELPIIEDKKEDIMNEEMYPFLKLMDNDSIMSSHCLFKSFDDVPTTLSRKFLTDFLRGEVGFKGLVISDGMEMKAIYDHYGIEKGCIMALNAGCDILLVCHEKELQEKAINAVRNAVKNGEIDLEELKAKVRRINEAKKRTSVGLKKYLNFDKPYEIKEEDHRIMEDIVFSSFTLFYGKAPIYTKDALIYTPKAIVGSIVEEEFNSRDLTKALRKIFDNEIIEFNEETDFVNKQIEYINKNNVKDVIVYSYDAFKMNNQINLIKELANQNINLYVVSLKGPMDRLLFKNIKNYSCLYEYTPNSIKCIIEQLKGNIKTNNFDFKI